MLCLLSYGDMYCKLYVLMFGLWLFGRFSATFITVPWTFIRPVIVVVGPTTRARLRKTKRLHLLACQSDQGDARGLRCPLLWRLAPEVSDALVSRH